jgi:hypothetical protein
MATLIHKRANPLLGALEHELPEVANARRAAQAAHAAEEAAKAAPRVATPAERAALSGSSKHVPIDLPNNLSGGKPPLPEPVPGATPVAPTLPTPSVPAVPAKPGGIKGLWNRTSQFGDTHLGRALGGAGTGIGAHAVYNRYTGDRQDDPWNNPWLWMGGGAAAGLGQGPLLWGGKRLARAENMGLRLGGYGLQGPGYLAKGLAHPLVSGPAGLVAYPLYGGMRYNHGIAGGQEFGQHVNDETQLKLNTAENRLRALGQNPGETPKPDGTQEPPAGATGGFFGTLKDQASSAYNELPNWGKVLGLGGAALGGGYLMNRALESDEDDRDKEEGAGRSMMPGVGTVAGLGGLGLGLGALSGWNPSKLLQREWLNKTGATRPLSMYKHAMPPPVDLSDLKIPPRTPFPAETATGPVLPTPVPGGEAKPPSPLSETESLLQNPVRPGTPKPGVGAGPSAKGPGPVNQVPSLGHTPPPKAEPTGAAKPGTVEPNPVGRDTEPAPYKAPATGVLPGPRHVDVSQVANMTPAQLQQLANDPRQSQWTYRHPGPNVAANPPPGIGFGPPPGPSTVGQDGLLAGADVGPTGPGSWEPGQRVGLNQSAMTTAQPVTGEPAPGSGTETQVSPLTQKLVDQHFQGDMNAAQAAALKRLQEMAPTHAPPGSNIWEWIKGVWNGMSRDQQVMLGLGLGLGAVGLMGMMGGGGRGGGGIGGGMIGPLLGIGGLGLAGYMGYQGYKNYADRSGGLNPQDQGPGATPAVPGTAPGAPGTPPTAQPGPTSTPPAVAGGNADPAKVQAGLTQFNQMLPQATSDPKAFFRQLAQMRNTYSPAEVNAIAAQVPDEQWAQLEQAAKGIQGQANIPGAGLFASPEEIQMAQGLPDQVAAMRQYAARTRTQQPAAPGGGGNTTPNNPAEGPAPDMTEVYRNSPEGQNLQAFTDLARTTSPDKLLADMPASRMEEWAGKLTEKSQLFGKTIEDVQAALAKDPKNVQAQEALKTYTAAKQNTDSLVNKIQSLQAARQQYVGGQANPGQDPLRRQMAYTQLAQQRAGAPASLTERAAKLRELYNRDTSQLTAGQLREYQEAVNPGGANPVGTANTMATNLQQAEPSQAVKSLADAAQKGEDVDAVLSNMPDDAVKRIQDAAYADLYNQDPVFGYPGTVHDLHKHIHDRAAAILQARQNAFVAQ